MLAETHPDFLSIRHIVKVGIGVGWVRVDIATDYYTQNMDKIKREIWGLALAVTVAGLPLLGAAILRSHQLLHQRETEVENNRQFLPGETVFGVISRHWANRLSSLLQND